MDIYSSLDTVDVASVKVCPMEMDSFCVGDRCMAWRWAVDVPGSTEPTRGFCGFAIVRQDDLPFNQP